VEEILHNIQSVVSLFVSYFITLIRWVMSSKMVKGQRAEAEIGVMAPRLNDRRIKNLNQTTEGN
jgi:hypothetical protein